MTRASPGVPSRPDGRSREAAALQVIRVPCSHCVRTLTEGVIAAHKTPANEALLRTRTADPLLTMEVQARDWRPRPGPCGHVSPGNLPLSPVPSARACPHVPNPMYPPRIDRSENKQRVCAGSSAVRRGGENPSSGQRPISAEDPQVPHEGALDMASPLDVIALRSLESG